MRHTRYCHDALHVSHISCFPFPYNYVLSILCMRLGIIRIIFSPFSHQTQEHFTISLVMSAAIYSILESTIFFSMLTSVDCIQLYSHQSSKLSFTLGWGRIDAPETFSIQPNANLHIHTRIFRSTVINFLALAGY